MVLSVAVGFLYVLMVSSFFFLMISMSRKFICVLSSNVGVSFMFTCIWSMYVFILPVVVLFCVIDYKDVIYVSGVKGYHFGVQ